VSQIARRYICRKGRLLGILRQDTAALVLVVVNAPTTVFELNTAFEGVVAVVILPASENALTGGAVYRRRFQPPFQWDDDEVTQRERHAKAETEKADEPGDPRNHFLQAADEPAGAWRTHAAPPITAACTRAIAAAGLPLDLSNAAIPDGYSGARGKVQRCADICVTPRRSIFLCQGISRGSTSRGAISRRGKKEQLDQYRFACGERDRLCDPRPGDPRSRRA